MIQPSIKSPSTWNERYRRNSGSSAWSRYHVVLPLFHFPGNCIYRPNGSHKAQTSDDPVLDNFPIADYRPEPQSLGFPEPHLRRYRSSGRALLERSMECFSKDANCFEPCHLLSGRASLGIGTNSASLRRQPHSQRSPLPLRGPLFVMGLLEERKWKK
jgi:hypothetical protein